jgi:hypothetical protein
MTVVSPVVFTHWVNMFGGEMEEWFVEFCELTKSQVPFINFATFVFNNTDVGRFYGFFVDEVEEIIHPSTRFMPVYVDESQMAEFLIDMRLNSNFLNILKEYEYPSNIPPVAVERDQSDEESGSGNEEYSSYGLRKIIY